MISLEDVAFQYEDMAMRFTLEAPKGSLTAIIGPSGAGKSTLLSLIAGFEVPLSGSIRIDGRDMAGVPPDQRPVSMIFQDNNVFGHLDLRQNVAIGLSPSLKLTPSQSAETDDALRRVGLHELQHRKPQDVSGGERQRVAIARALVRDRPVLLLDEPFAALGPALRRQMLDLLREFQADKHLTILMVSHQPEDARYAASHTAFVEAGRILAMGPTEELFRTKDLPELRDYLGDWRS
ncbi:MAG: thiamine ABC transporter ATP-binding protein [Rhizobiales bacterium]|nr:thiamine ABC transporter ATP-binding protein [Hyphomicrobiales bacterium]